MPSGVFHASDVPNLALHSASRVCLEGKCSRGEKRTCSNSGGCRGRKGKGVMKLRSGDTDSNRNWWWLLLMAV